MKIIKQEQLTSLDIDIVTKQKMVEQIEVLNDNYGANRKLTDLGGFLIHINDQEELKELLKQFPIQFPEYIDEYQASSQETYAEVLLLASSDYHIVMYMNKSLLDKSAFMEGEV